MENKPALKKINQFQFNRGSRIILQFKPKMKICIYERTTNMLNEIVLPWEFL